MFRGLLQIKIFKSTHQTLDNLNKQPPHFLKHARSVDRDAIWNVDANMLKNVTLFFFQRNSLP